MAKELPRRGRWGIEKFLPGQLLNCQSLGRLSISVNKQESEEDKSKTYLHKETSSWSATRGIYLKDASTSGLTAKLEGGILTVNVPKQTEKENVTKIQID